jgi:hypothetical protein
MGPLTITEVTMTDLLHANGEVTVAQAILDRRALPDGAPDRVDLEYRRLFGSFGRDTDYGSTSPQKGIR